ncbi:hypothetical protein HKBW3S03_00442, partial [Candidatus Hakubella thermalkaliphila]
QNSA